VLEHSLIYALIEIDHPASTLAGLSAASPRAKRVSLIALDQMDHGALTADQVIPLMTSPDAALQQTAWWIGARHADWGGSLASFFEKRLASAALTPAEQQDLQQKLAQFGEQPAIQSLLAEAVGRTGSGRVVALRAMAAAAASGRLKELPASWLAPLVRALDAEEEEVVQSAVAALRAAATVRDSSGGLEAALLRAARRERFAPAVRLEALAAVPGGLSRVDADLFELLRTSLQPSAPVLIRGAAATAIERAKLDRAQLLSLARSLEHAGPLELPRLLRAFEQAGDEQLGLEVLGALERSPVRSALRAEALLPRLAKYPAPVQKRAEALIASVNADAATQSKRLEELLDVAKGGDVRRGQAIFNSDKAACLACHAIGYLGGRIGPDLTRIGQVRSERDLLEAIVFPNASFARSYEPIVVATRGGATHMGVLRSESSEDVVLATAAGQDLRIARKDVADMQPGTVSLMPSGFGEQLTRQELADLLAFLKATKPGAN
jgi:putative heme-binding domain-containing protein